MAALPGDRRGAARRLRRRRALTGSVVAGALGADWRGVESVASQLRRDSRPRLDLNMPPVRLTLVERPRLLDLVERERDGPLTLISAPAGSGKTVLLRTWMASADEPETIAHVALSARARAAPHVLGRRARRDRAGAPRAHRPRGSRAGPELARAGSERARRACRSRSCSSSTTSTRSAPATLPEDLEWLLEQVPAGLRLVLATRSDPPLRLQRLRVAGRLAEIRAADLAFTRVGGGGVPRPARRCRPRRRDALGALRGLGRRPAARGALAPGPPRPGRLRRRLRRRRPRGQRLPACPRWSAATRRTSFGSCSARRSSSR